ncbi:MAG: hypothetical protein RRZ71_05720 [Clostridia bacterium]
MKKIAVLCALFCVLLTACTQQVEQIALPVEPHIAWEIQTPAPLPAPTIAVDLSDARERGFEQIDIDKNDGYQDFVLENRITDGYGESTFFRFVDGNYIELGSLTDYVTNKLGTPHITLDGAGYLYVNEHSAHLGWTRIDRIYTVIDNALTEIPPLHHVYYPIEETEFEVRDFVCVYTTGFSTQALKELSPETHPAFDWETMGAEGYGKRKSLGKGDRVTVFGTDECGSVLLDYKGKAYLVPMMTQEQSVVWGDLTADGKFFNEYFYNERVEDYFHRG